jgi:hypothetical protein
VWVAWLGVAQASCIEVLVAQMNAVVAPLAEQGQATEAVRGAIAAGTATLEAVGTCSAAEKALWTQSVTAFESFLVPMTELSAQIAIRPLGPLSFDAEQLARLERGLILALSGAETHPQHTYTLGPPDNGLSDSSWRMLASHHEAALVRLHNQVATVTARGLDALAHPEQPLVLAEIQDELTGLCELILVVEPLGQDSSLRDSALAECRGLQGYYQQAAPLLQQLAAGKRERRARRELRVLLERVEELQSNEAAFKAERASFRERWELPALPQGS